MPSSLIVQSSLNYFSAPQPAATNSMQSTYTPHLQHLFNWRCTWNQVEHLWWSFFCRNSRCIKVVGYFCRRAPSWMFDRILDATLSHNLLWLAECLRRSFPSLGLHKGILDSPCFLILLIYTKHKPKDETLD